MQRFYLKLTCSAALVVAVGTVIAVAISAGDALADSSTTKLPDGGSIVTVTTRNGTECSMFSKQGALMCTRSIGVTDHQTAIARCIKMKC